MFLNSQLIYSGCGFSDDVTDLEDDVIDDGQFTPGVKVDDLARSSQGGLLAPVVSQLLPHQHEPSPLPWAESRIELRQVATVVYSLTERERERWRWERLFLNRACIKLSTLHSKTLP